MGMQRSWRRLGGLAAVFLLGSGPAWTREGFRRFLPVPPVWQVVDEPLEKEPKEHESNVVGDSMRTLLTRRIDRALGIHDETLALDINSLDEVPDSSWFENRLTRRQVGAEAAFFGPSAHDGSSAPPPGAPLLVVSAKLIGANPGFIVQDPARARYVVKFDPPETPETQTAADVIGTRLAWLLGFNVPQDNLFVFRREQLSIKPGVEVRDRATGRKRQMTEQDLDGILARTYRNPDGSYRALLSRFVAGKPIGGAPQEGVRRDDPNDRIPHEERRTLRAWRVFGAWLKHTDLKEDNMLDAYVTEGGKSFVRHYFIDFGEIFAGQAAEGGFYRDGFEYSFDPAAIGASLFTLGFRVHPWERVRDTGIRGVGPFGAEPFTFYAWKTLRPNRFMNRMTDLDAFWGVRRLYALTDEHIAEAIRAGQFSDPRAGAYLLDTLKKRRETIAREVLARVNPAAAFSVLDGGAALGFEDFALRHGLAQASATRWRVQLVVLGPEAERAQPPLDLKEPKVPLGIRPAAGEQLLVRLQTLREGRPLGQPAHVHLADPDGAGLRIIAIDRWRTGPTL
jgi:hypothetical protein